MATIDTRNFKGFTKHAIEFLVNLKENNNKPWFEENKRNYIEYILTPMQNLVMDLSYPMLSIDPYIETAPSVGKTISRIYRDTRFSKDKSPYRSCIWMTFKRPSKEWQDAPAFFFEVTESAYRYGMGFYSASKDAMDGLRELINAKPDEFQEILTVFNKHKIFHLEGEKYKRLLSPELAEEILEWYQRKNLYLVCNRDIDNLLFSYELVDELMSSFNAVSEIYHYFYKAKGFKTPE